jgi:hypothetical protein
MAVSCEPDRVTRRFGLGDGLILLVAVAIVLERFRAIHWFQFFPRSFRWCWEAIGYLLGLSYWSPELGLTRGGVARHLPVEVIRLLLYTFCPVLLGLMVAQPLIRLKRPRPTMAEVARQSGLVTCLIGLVTVAVLLSIGDLWFSGLALTLGLTRVMLLTMLWPLLALPPWRAEPSWVDRLGRAVGWGWMLALAGAAVLESMGWI